MAEEGAPAVAEPAEPAAADGGKDPEASAEGGEGKEDKSKKTLEQMMSLKPGDDERTEISKKISWICRHGAKKVGLDIDDNGWIKLTDLLENDILKGVTMERLMETIEASNAQKPRYEVGEVEDGSKAIRAIAKHTIQGMTSAPRAEKGSRRRDYNAEGGKGDDEGGKGKGSYERDWEKGGGKGGGKDWEKGGGKDWNGGKGGAGGLDGGEPRDGPTFEQQLQDGYRPVYQGNRVVAMVKNGDLVRPGRRGKGDYKGDFKGKGKDGGKGKDNHHDDWHDGGKGYGGGYGGYDGGKGKGKGKGKGNDFSQYDGHGQGGGWQPQRPPNRWMVVVKEEVMVKESHIVSSPLVGKLHSGDVVTQTAPEQVIEHGIVRMPIEHRAPGGHIVNGWVTRTAEAANGPCFFKAVGGGYGNDGHDNYKGGGKGGGGGWYGGGCGKGGGGGMGKGHGGHGKGNGKYGGSFN